jgi:hypothetical protein
MTKRPRQRRGESGSARVPSRETFPALRAFVRGYLHEDFAAVHGSIGEAAAAFRAEASDEERDQLVEELESLEAVVADLPQRLLRRFVEDLGSGWMPSSRADIIELLESIRGR